MIVAVVLATLAGSALLALVVLTAIGARRRGRGFPAAVVGGLFFPVTWVIWHVVDRDAYQTSPSR